MTRYLAAMLLALSGIARGEVQVFEQVQWQKPVWAGPEHRISVAEQGEWIPLTLPHHLFRDLPPIYTRVWYRTQFHFDHAPPGGHSLYFPRLELADIAVYVNLQRIWQLSDVYRPWVPLNAVRIPIPPGLLHSGENTIHLQASADPKRLHGVSRIYFGETVALSERAAMRSLLQDQLATVVAAAFGAIGLLSLWLWLRAGRDPVLLWYGVSGVILLAATVLWYLSMWRPEFLGWRTGLSFIRNHGYLAPLFVLHLRIAGRRHAWLEFALWLVVIHAFLRMSSAAGAAPHSYFGWGIVFSVLPVLLTVPLLMAPTLRTKPTVLLLVVADFAACVLPLHDWAMRLGLVDFDSLSLVSLAPPFVMLAAAAPIVERMRASTRAAELDRLELERRVAEKTHEIKESHEKLRQAQREQELAEERRRIMADMHDGLGGRLVALLSVAQSGRASASEISNGLVAALDELRLLVDSVQPAEGDVSVVLGSVRHRMRSVFERTGTRLVWNVSALPRMEDLTPERILAIQRIFLEVFANAVRHSGARTVSVFATRVPGAVRVVIEDDGRGFDPAAQHAGTGLRNLQVRAMQAGGMLSVDSQAGKGTRVTLSLPLEGEDPPEPLPDSGQKPADCPVPGMAADAASS